MFPEVSTLVPHLHLKRRHSRPVSLHTRQHDRTPTLPTSIVESCRRRRRIKEQEDADCLPKLQEAQKPMSAVSRDPKGGDWCRQLIGKTNVSASLHMEHTIVCCRCPGCDIILMEHALIQHIFQRRERLDPLPTMQTRQSRLRARREQSRWTTCKEETST